MKTTKSHIALVLISFGLGGVVITGLAGIGILYLVRIIWDDQLFASISYLGAFFIAAVPGLVGSLYWSYFFIKKERHETKHLDDGKYQD